MAEDSLMMLLMPEMMASAQERYDILREIHESQPVGRPFLAAQTKLSDSVIRKHLTALEQAGLIAVHPRGIRLTNKGISILAPLSHYFQKSPALSDLEKKLARVLSMERVILVRGDADAAPEVRQDIALEAGLFLMRVMADGDVIAVSGGHTMWTLVEALPRFHMDVDVLPARGGFGQDVKCLPNVVAARLADKLGGRNYVVHIPDGLPPDLYLKVKNALPRSKHMDELYTRVNVLLTGVNTLEGLSYWEELPEDVRSRLSNEEACGEALGAFADAKGNIIYRLYNVGLSVDELSAVPHVIIAAGGSRKGLSILAMARAGVRGTLITDEGAARSILSMSHSISGKPSRRVQTS